MKKLSTIILISAIAVSALFGQLFASPASQAIVTPNNQLEKLVTQLEDKFNVSITVDSDALSEKLINSYDEIENSSSIDKALDLLTEGTNLKAEKLRDDYYVIKKQNSNKDKIPDGDTLSVVTNGKRTITGIITDKGDSFPMPGVSVVIKGTTIGTVSNVEGFFSIEVGPKDKVLTVSFMGMKTINKNIEGISVLALEMEEDAFGLDEIIIAGVAAATPKKNLTISVAKIDGDLLQEAYASSPATAMQGKVSGVTVVQAGGQPGAGASIRLRGSTSLNGSQKPLIILDGVIINTNLADISVDNIASMDVVKGAAAAALYGSRAGNGVIVITTKRGATEIPGTTTVQIRQEIGTQEVAKYIDQATHQPYELADDWQDFSTFTKYAGVTYDDAGNPTGGNRILTENQYADQDYSRLIDHQREFFKKGIYAATFASVMGNTNKTNFLIGYEYNRQQGVIFETDGYKRNNFRINLDHKLSDKIKLSTSNLFIKTQEDNPGSNTSFYNLLYVSPDIDLYAPNANGTPYKILPDPWSVAENPLYPLANRTRTAKRTSVIGNFQGTYDAAQWVSLVAKYTYEYRNKSWNTYTPKGYLAGAGSTIGGSIYMQNYNEFNQNLQFTGNFNKQFNDFTAKLKLSYLYENSTWNNFSVLGKDFLVSGVPQLENTDPELASINSYEGKIIAINYFGIVDVDYKDKYLLSALYRYDGSSLFGENARWNPYYRFSLGYRITEDFEIPGIQELKIRASLGTSGLRPGFSWQYETWEISNGVLSKKTLGNKNLKPSETTEFEIGLNVDFLSRFSFVFTYSESSTEDAFALAPLPSHLGFPSQWQNVGTLASRVFEATLDVNIVDKKNFSWDVFVNYDNIRQKITKLNIPEYNTGPRNTFLFKQGETFGIMYGYEWVNSLEVMANQLPTGETIADYEINNEGYVIHTGTEGTPEEKAIKLDVDGDGTPDKVVIGDGNPAFNMNLGSTINFHNFSLFFLMSWKSGGDVYNYSYQYTFRDLRALEIDQFGKPEDQKKSITYYSNFYDGTGINSYFVEDASFLKFRELSLYYTFDEKQLSGVFGGFFKGVKIGFQGRNLLTISNYRGYDPEVATGDDATNFPFDDFGYPNFRTYTGSIQLTF